MHHVVPQLVIPYHLLPPPPRILSEYSTNEPAGFCVHPNNKCLLMDDDDDGEVIAVIPAPRLETHREIAHREISVLKTLLDQEDHQPIDPYASAEADAFIRSGWRRMARGYLNRPQLNLAPDEIETLCRALNA